MNSSEKKVIYWFLAVVIVFTGGIWLFTRTTSTLDTAVLRYEEFQEIHNACTKLNEDLCNMRELPEEDKMFEQFSKNQRINTLKTQLNRWVEDYNAKSKMWNRSLWKSSALPYQLATNQFNCYQNQ